MYTVVPRLLQGIDNLTNWYIRFNRKRLKGTAGLGTEDTTAALNTLFQVLFTVVRAMAPFAPFITEHIYCLLRPYLGDCVDGVKNKSSVHFLPFPTVQEELMDTVIERKVAAMQRVIKLARVARERRSVSLKTPLKSLVVIGDAQLMSDIAALQSYITEELNVNEIILTSDAGTYNIRLEAKVDWPNLGKRLKTDVQVVREALPGLTQEDLRRYQREKRITVDGIHLEGNDLSIVRVMPTNDAEARADKGPSWEPSFDDYVVVLLDCASYPELEYDGMARDLITRFQKLRKKAKLVPLDHVRMQYVVVSNPEGVDMDALVSARRYLYISALRGQPEQLLSEDVQGTDQESLLIEEDEFLGALSLRLRLSQI